MDEEWDPDACPDRDAWGKRRHWFDEAGKAAEGLGEIWDTSEQVEALFVDVKIAFCAGAWLAVIILAAAVVDTHLREYQVPEGFVGNAARLLDAAHADPALHGLRQRRNALMHLDDRQAPAVTINDRWDKRPELEGEAREAVHLMFRALCMGGPWV